MPSVTQPETCEAGRRVPCTGRTSPLSYGMFRKCVLGFLFCLQHLGQRLARSKHSQNPENSMNSCLGPRGSTRPRARLSGNYPGPWGVGRHQPCPWGQLREEGSQGDGSDLTLSYSLNYSSPPDPSVTFLPQTVLPSGGFLQQGEGWRASPPHTHTAPALSGVGVLGPDRESL